MIVTWGDLRELIRDTNIIRRYAVNESNFCFVLNILACLAVLPQKASGKKSQGSSACTILNPKWVVDTEHTGMYVAALSEKASGFKSES